ncbi:MAG: hypothetical protein PHC43_07100 [Candidatus Marinimicrobia bacterium]|nr:hypothetical protein [Candidatus Neomarinimicrobiota bacterium]
MQNDFLLIGIDGGATKVNGWSVVVEDNGKAFKLGNFNSIKSYSELPGYIRKFQPVDLNLQLKEWETGKIALTDEEVAQSNCYIEATTACISEIIQLSNKKRILIGIGMPGIKTQDERGIAVLKNGPRMLDYARRIEQDLENMRIELLKPIGRLGSDAHYCGIGEEYAGNGSFRRIENAYYLGGGTGVADALKLKGKVVALDAVKNWFVKTWEMKCPDGYSVEKYMSASGIQAIYGELTGNSQDELQQAGIYSPQIRERALSGDKPAIETLQKVAHFSALLLYERITTIYAGWQGLFDFVNPQRSIPAQEYDYRGLLLDRLIIGQRLGDLMEEAQDDAVLWKPFASELTQLILTSRVLDQVARDHYCPAGNLNPALIKISKLREAPALGAGIDAYLNWKEENHA